MQNARCAGVNTSVEAEASDSFDVAFFVIFVDLNFHDAFAEAEDAAIERKGVPQKSQIKRL